MLGFLRRGKDQEIELYFAPDIYPSVSYKVVLSSEPNVLQKVPILSISRLTLRAEGLLY